jgi:hypothetical protein
MGISSKLLILGFIALASADATHGEEPLAFKRTLIGEAVHNVMTLDRPGQDGLVNVSDGTKYVQCRRMPNRSLHCESAGTVMQPSLARILTRERINRLTALGWHLDPSFGNYARTLPVDASPMEVTRTIVEVLQEAYGVEIADVSVESIWIRSNPCPPRAGPSQTRAGMITDEAKLMPTAVRGCLLAPEPPLPAHSAEDLLSIYGTRIVGELLRLRVNYNGRVFVVLDIEAGYVQCASTGSPGDIYCEAQSAESWPGLSKVLTAGRIARLHAAGFAEPGRSPNYWKTYTGGSDEAIARELLDILYSVYGYDGSKQLIFRDEKFDG